jgi:N-dimethylarginine dimethylaminohydrolase
MRNTKINQTVLMSGPKFFRVEELNPYSDVSDQPNVALAVAEFESIKIALESASVNVIKVNEPKGCQDGIFTANWGLCRGNTAILSSLPNMRQAEQPFAKKYLQSLGKKVVEAPFRFSGQGDALPCGNLLFCGSSYRTDPQMHQFLADTFDYEVVPLQTVPEMNASGAPVTNKVTGWPDSFFYDIDLAISILRDDLVAWCPEAFMPESQEKMRALDIDKIEVSLEEAMHFACNLVSTGETVIMSAAAPKLQAAIEARGLATITPPIHELAKGGGYIRCTTLTLDNK